jgi:N-acetylmuramoyl-L-alanine amidase
MRATLIPILLLVSMGRGSAAQQRSTLELTAVRFWTLSEVTRIAIEVNGEFEFRSDSLHNPERLFFDLLGTKPRVRGMQTTPVGDKLLKRIRVAETQRGTTRVVLDLESTVEHTASQLSNPERLIIELRPAGARAVSAVRSPERPKKKETPAEEVLKLETPKLDIPKPEISKLQTPRLETPKLEIPRPETRKLEIPKPKQVAARTLETGPALTKPAVEGKPLIPIPLPASPTPPQPPALAAKRNSSGDRTLIRALGLKVGRVVIDPGHGGHDRGSVGPGGLLEKELVLDVAQRLGALIEERLGSQVIYTRTDDSFVSLESRTEMANENRADLFLSIHANSSRYPAASGVETYYLNFSSTREALDLASRENAGSQKTIHELSEIIEKITKHDKAEESREFAAKMQASLYTAVNKSNPSARNRGVKKAPFVVLIGATMPSILAEIGFLSNVREENLLKRADHRQKLAEALYRGLSRYAETLSHFQVAARD